MLMNICSLWLCNVISLWLTALTADDVYRLRSRFLSQVGIYYITALSGSNLGSVTINDVSICCTALLLNNICAGNIFKQQWIKPSCSLQM